MKIRNMKGFPPSVKGGYCTLLVLFFTPSLFSQSHDWEIGIGLRPLTLKEEPYSFIAKKFISRGVALRMGAGLVYTQKSEYFSYQHPYTDTIHIFSYEYTRVDKNLYASSFVGLQYGKRKNDFYWYGATDLSFMYKWEHPDIPNGVLFPGQQILKGGDYFQAAAYSQDKSFVFGISQALGIQYRINTSVSLSLESSFYYRISFLTWQSFLFAMSANVTADEISCHCGGSSFQKKRLAYIGFSPLTFLSFNYHF